MLPVSPCSAYALKFKEGCGMRACALFIGKNLKNKADGTILRENWQD
jgi:hypothetical protein